ncbi:MAG: cob(I)yrinic acid a,c-diamide adenosyltransferase [Lutibacter sp.]|uniref:cob(I)yrinic acid a,c-diamide adenosyltransferase n=1 Tax=Lutibacter sp. TaxID=1925666 RepID=UPI0017AF3589|nr:cob(I)yrinic acid a,c-diamide adenosyltransferase [Lutibacter sp.]MBT8316132.1 cob(I)yrinic acid a,c-diamide adenosyltransferase [Lutibacter sp.]NNJ56992.1 cob(I)yrinic acid a,c-diamide adenosyltransferase [Lutibacter sp.]
MKIYTKTGDKGTTSLFGGTRVPKYHLRIEAYGTVDELNSYIGLIRDQKIDEHTSTILLKIQHELFILGSMLATPPEKKVLKNGKERLNIDKISKHSIELLENEIDAMNELLPDMTHFILPGGHTTVSYCHIARCICRRAERVSTHLSDESTIESEILIYLNRLSDYLFVLARKLTKDNRAQEIKWIPERIK